MFSCQQCGISHDRRRALYCLPCANRRMRAKYKIRQRLEWKSPYAEAGINAHKTVAAAGVKEAR